MEADCSTDGPTFFALRAWASLNLRNTTMLWSKLNDFNFLCLLLSVSNIQVISICIFHSWYMKHLKTDWVGAESDEQQIIRDQTWHSRHSLANGTRIQYFVSTEPTVFDLLTSLMFGLLANGAFINTLYSLQKRDFSSNVCQDKLVGFDADALYRGIFIIGSKLSTLMLMTAFILSECMIWEMILLIFKNDAILSLRWGDIYLKSDSCNKYTRFEHIPKLRTI